MQVRLTNGCRVLLTFHGARPTPRGASRLVQQAMSAWSVKIRRAPSRPCRDARVYGHTTTAVHEIEYISPIEYTTPPSLSLFPSLCTSSRPWKLSGHDAERIFGRHSRQHRQGWQRTRSLPLQGGGALLY